MMFWLFAAVMTAVAVGLVLRPLLSGHGKPRSRMEFDLDIYRDQLAEIDRDIARGVLAADQVRSARLEIERRMLAASSDADANARPSVSASRLAVIIVAIAGPLAALGLYLQLGEPHLPAQPFDSRAAPLAGSDLPGGESSGGQADMAALAKQLADRMAADPNDPKGWRLLGRAYSTLGQFDKSAEAYANAIAHGADDAATHSARGESLAMLAAGIVTEPALQAFEAAVRIDPMDSRARYYLALAEAQAGRLRTALDLWVELEADGAPDAPWLKTVATRVDQTARDLGLDPMSLPGRRRPEISSGPTADDMAAAAAMSPEARQVFISGMVDSLAQRMKDNPGDLAGWQKLGRAYAVMGDFPSARTAWARAAELAPDDLEVLLSYAEVLIGDQSDESNLPAAFAPLVARIRAMAPDNKLGLFYGGLVERAAGNPAAARVLWQRLLDQLPADSPNRDELQRRLDDLGNGG
ncbi:MAG: c-type cytochrome biogenesis protein CcmI [Dongiaceae bacterium]